MKKVLFVLAVAACVLSCRSVKNVGNAERHHYSRDADTLVTVSNTERRDSSGHYRRMVDSLSVELQSVRRKYRDLYVKDSISTNQYRTDSEHVKDTTWMQINADGSITYHHYREKNTYSHQQLERYRQQIVKESRHTIDSLIERNTYLQAQYDSIYKFKSLADNASIYRARADSLSDHIREMERTTIYKNSIWDKLKVAGITVAFLIILFAVILVYMKFFRRR